MDDKWEKVPAWGVVVVQDWDGRSEIYLIVIDLEGVHNLVFRRTAEITILMSSHFCFLTLHNLNLADPCYMIKEAKS